MATLNRITFATLLLAANLTLAQSYHVQSITVKDGLISNQVNSITQDNSGQIWISTLKGLTRYDGLIWFGFPDSLIVPTNTDTRLQTLPDGRILMAGHAFNNKFIVQVFDGDSVMEIQTPAFEARTRLLWEVTKVSGRLFFHLLANDTLRSYSFDHRKWTILPLPDILKSQVNRLRAFGDELFLLTRIGIYKVEREEFNRITPENIDGVVPNISDILKTDSCIYVLGRKWLGKLCDGKVTVLLNRADQEGLTFSQLRINRYGFLFFRSDSHYNWFHISSGDHLRFTADNDDAIPANSTLYIDKESNLWITTYRGIHKISTFQFLGFTPNSGFLEYEISAIEEIGDNRFFLGGQRSYAILENRSVQYRKFLNEGLQGKTRILSVAKDNNGTLFMAGQDLGLGRLQQNENEVTWSKLPDGAAEVVFFSNDTLFVSTQQGNLYTYRNNTFKPYIDFSAYPRNIYSIDNSTKLVCSSSGLRILRGKQVEIVTLPNNVFLRNVYCMLPFKGKYYLGTDAGLAEWFNDTIKVTTLFGYSISFPVYAIRYVNDEEIWLGTDKGIVKVTQAGIVNFGEKEGLFGTEINRSAFLISSGGDLLVGTNKGLNLYDPKMSFPVTQVYPPEIISIEVGSDSIPNPWNSMELDAYNNNLTINIRSINFTMLTTSFRYRMVGFEKDWSILTSEDIREVQYRNLPHGTYQFELQSRLGNGPWSESSLSSKVVVRQAFYTTWTFIVLAFVAAIGLGFLVNRIITQFTMNRKLRETIQAKIKEIEINEAKLQLALENSKLGVWTYNFENQQVHLTPKIFEILNLPADTPQLTSQQYSELIHADDRDLLQNSLDAAIRNHQLFDIEIRLGTGNKAYRWMHIKGKCLYHQDGRPYMLSGTLSDIDERKQYEADRERLIRELEQTNRELDRFVYSASHDLSAPMKSVMGLINLARMNASPAEIQNYLTLIDKSIRKQDEFIKEIIAFARNTRTKVEIESINLRELVEETLSNLKYADQYANSEFDISIEETCGELKGDRTRLKIILNNLISNAIKFQRRGTGSHIVKITATRTNGAVNIRVEDNGEGIRPEHQKRIFDMFFRGTENAPGSGLGLYIAKEAAEKIGGHIQVKSTYGTGSCFTLIMKANPVGSSTPQEV